jgi:hypothetical protein
MEEMRSRDGVEDYEAGDESGRKKISLSLWLSTSLQNPTQLQFPLLYSLLLGPQINKYNQNTNTIISYMREKEENCVYVLVELFMGECECECMYVKVSDGFIFVS